MKGYSAFPKAPHISGVSPSNCLMSYLGPSLGMVMQAVYSTAPADSANNVNAMEIAIMRLFFVTYSSGKERLNPRTVKAEKVAVV